MLDETKPELKMQIILWCGINATIIISTACFIWYTTVVHWHKIDEANRNNQYIVERK